MASTNVLDPAKKQMSEVPGKKQVNAAVRVVVDSGATDHFFNSSRNHIINVANGAPIKILGQGAWKFEIDESRRGTIRNVLHVPDFANSQLSGYGSRFVNGNYVLFKAHMAEDWMPKLQTEAI
jgi:hypothetical protein